ncbi:ribosome hibernation-promoting factor, HPF/YfiA family [Corynebacterium uberis]|uniref:ribosome hibernation-promoting factor, HPF/YfiA family n=1 Tax=Corynebacterium TaxID=1716 RepID=UPI001D0A4D45|nr:MULTISPECIES: ribosome-associated translation inhibitor RaiA [Corynebacterium]MCZ9309226.1 ribosome-associated translation inhibitor RaiA [Corynebacterium sp. c6VSa_13]UDL72784.1 ribosome-associated translation inhibitor RaiA [Corynebacterium uberis]UDL76339.1 ribosome-associated translation inhibitor RaiA [Corynebacterium uberis]UDL78551.1 ribosome-associated translation inhibitor RaiA [Corynebacterium uberis]UDL80832.1 ribosome-associated translation inhibitor RaiA [Corynebacterium uberis
MSDAAEHAETLSPEARVSITGRNVEVPEHFAERVNSKLAKIEKLDPTLTFFHVELQHEPNPRRESQADRIQITATGKGHIARAEAKEDSFYAALETALGKMQRSLRKVKARRSIAQSGHRAPKGAGELAAGLAHEAERARENQGQYDVDPYADQIEESLPGRIVRTKEHPATPMSVDDALSEMELVGHDFYLFVDEETQRPSVVYRRHAYDYGLISLTEEN